MPSGAGYEVVFCPAGRSTNILATLGNEMRTLASTGKVPKLVNLRNASWVKEQRSGASAAAGVTRSALAVLGGALAITALVSAA